MSFRFDFDDIYKDAIIIKLISEWNANSKQQVDRTTIQKLCYFAEAVDVPLGYKFSVYKHGPYSQELNEHIDDMVCTDLVTDKNSENELKTTTSSYSASEDAIELLVMYKDELSKTEDKILFLVEYFKDKPLRDLELFSTTHYYYAANKGFFQALDENGIRDRTIKKVVEAKKGEFEHSEVLKAYLALVETPQFC